MSARSSSDRTVVVVRDSSETLDPLRFSSRAPQLVLVESIGTTAQVSALESTAPGAYRRVLGPYPGFVGRGAAIDPALKREGDGATPRGQHPLRTGFGALPDPGLALGWIRAHADLWWVDDPASSAYNLMVDMSSTSFDSPAWSSAECLLLSPAYDLAQVVGFNEEQVPGAGSAIFLHVATGGPTAGCVSLSLPDPTEVLRWERPGVEMLVL